MYIEILKLPPNKKAVLLAPLKLSAFNSHELNTYDYGKFNK